MRRFTALAAVLLSSVGLGQSVTVTGPKYVPAKQANLISQPVRAPMPGRPAPSGPGQQLFWEVIAPAQPVVSTHPNPTAAASAPAPKMPQPKSESSAPQTPSPPRPKPKEPLTSPDLVGVSGQSWMEFDITEYTSRFQTGDRPEEGIRYWINKKTGDTWQGVDLACLSVSGERLKVYHTPAVQQIVAHTLGRFLHFTPGVFQCRLRVVSTRDSGWRDDFARYLDTLPAGVPGKGAWRTSVHVLDRLVQSMTSGVGDALILDQRFEAPNGQATVLDATQPRQFVRKPSPNLLESEESMTINDGLKVSIRPLISDGAGVEIDLTATVHRMLDQAALTLDGSREPPSGDLPEIWTSQTEVSHTIEHGQALIVSLGRGPTLDQRPNLLKPRRPETVLVLEIHPAAQNLIAGKSVPAPPVTAASVEQKTGATRRKSLSLTPREQEEKNMSRLTDTFNR